jgi:hypothetical protein
MSKCKGLSKGKQEEAGYLDGLPAKGNPDAGAAQSYSRKEPGQEQMPAPKKQPQEIQYPGA